MKNLVLKLANVSNLSVSELNEITSFRDYGVVYLVVLKNGTGKIGKSSDFINRLNVLRRTIGAVSEIIEVYVTTPHFNYHQNETRLLREFNLTGTGECEQNINVDNVISFELIGNIETNEEYKLRLDNKAKLNLKQTNVLYSLMPLQEMIEEIKTVILEDLMILDDYESDSDTGIYEITSRAGILIEEKHDVKVVFCKTLLNEQWFSVPTIADGIILIEFLEKNL